MVALASAITRAALASLDTLYLHSNQIGDTGLAAFSAALTGTVLPGVEKLWLYNNRLGNPGLTALADAIARGGLASLQSLHVEGNTAASKESLQAPMDALASRHAQT